MSSSSPSPENNSKFFDHILFFILGVITAVVGGVFSYYVLEWIESQTKVPPPQSIIETYHNYLDEEQYREAWDLLPKDFQENLKNHSEGFSSYEEFWQENNATIRDFDCLRVIAEDSCFITTENGDRKAIILTSYTKSSVFKHPLIFLLKFDKTTNSWKITGIKFS